jgi:spore maturation protein CgeB
MRILIFDTHYQESLRVVYENDPQLAQQTSTKQLRSIYETGFGRADSLPLNLTKLGHQTEQFIVNAAPIQTRWASENGLQIQPTRSTAVKVKQRLKLHVDRLRDKSALPGERIPKWEMEVLVAQARSFKPEVIFICDVLYLPAHFHRTLKNYTRLLVGEMAYPIPPGLDLAPFDLIISAAPHFVDRLRKAGAQSELLRLGFEQTILERLGTQTKNVELAFIGSVGKDHKQRLELLEELCRKVPISFWGAGADSLPADSPLRGRVKPPLWGYDMYRQLQRSRIALNIHIDMAEQYAANMRLYEATGVGTMLLTDWKTNLHELFEIGKEIVAYRSTEECVELVNHYLEHDEEREAIARAGQERTLSEHSYYHRMQELTEILNRYLSRTTVRKNLN